MYQYATTLPFFSSLLSLRSPEIRVLAVQTAPAVPCALWRRKISLLPYRDHDRAHPLQMRASELGTDFFLVTAQ